MATERLTYSIPEAAAVLGISRATLYRHIGRGLVKSFTWGGRRLIRADDLQAAVDAASGRDQRREA
jgi:excisionase family DNA binding protein